MYASSSKTDSSQLKAAARNAGESAVQSLEQAGQKVREAYDTTKSQITDVTTTASGRIRRHPLQTAAVALGIGYVLGRIFRR